MKNHNENVDSHNIKFPLHKDDFSDIIDSNGVLVYSAVINSDQTFNEAEANRNFVFEALSQHAALVAVAEAAQWFLTGSEKRAARFDKLQSTLANLTAVREGGAK